MDHLPKPDLPAIAAFRDRCPRRSSPVTSPYFREPVVRARALGISCQVIKSGMNSDLDFTLVMATRSRAEVQATYSRWSSLRNLNPPWGNHQARRQDR